MALDIVAQNLSVLMRGQWASGLYETASHTILYHKRLDGLAYVLQPGSHLCCSLCFKSVKV